MAGAARHPDGLSARRQRRGVRSWCCLLFERASALPTCLALLFDELAAVRAASCIALLDVARALVAAARAAAAARVREQCDVVDEASRGVRTAATLTRASGTRTAERQAARRAAAT
jgi:hypothetical protein